MDEQGLIIREEPQLELPPFAEPLSIEEAQLNIMSLGRNMAEHAYIVGKNLLWVKGRVKHGEFLLWIKRNLWFTDRTARRFIGFTERCDIAEKLLKEPHYLERPKSDKLSVLPPPFPIGKYSVLYADPPWSYQNVGFDQSAEAHYRTMSVEEICELPVPELCTRDTALFLWATSPLLPEALQVLEAWGFTYKVSMVWDKGRGPTIGWFVKTEHELILIGTREGNQHPLIKPPSILHIPRTGRHSEKPKEMYDLIESMYGGPWCELFARNERKGWEGWGDELDKDS